MKKGEHLCTRAPGAWGGSHGPGEKVRKNKRKKSLRRFREIVKEHRKKRAGQVDYNSFRKRQEGLKTGRPMHFCTNKNSSLAQIPICAGGDRSRWEERKKQK